MFVVPIKRKVGSMTKKLQKIATVLDALSNETRLRIFRLLAQNSAEGITPTELSKRLNDLPRNTLSFHLSLLNNADLCNFQKQGKQIFYKPNCKPVKEIVAFLLADCCEGDCKC